MKMTPLVQSHFMLMNNHESTICSPSILSTDKKEGVLGIVGKLSMTTQNVSTSELISVSDMIGMVK